jgi:hypothetical protein
VLLHTHGMANFKLSAVAWQVQGFSCGMADPRFQLCTDMYNSMLAPLQLPPVTLAAELLQAVQSPAAVLPGIWKPWIGYTRHIPT